MPIREVIAITKDQSCALGEHSGSIICLKGGMIPKGNLAVVLSSRESDTSVWDQSYFHFECYNQWMRHQQAFALGKAESADSEDWVVERHGRRI